MGTKVVFFFHLYKLYLYNPKKSSNFARNFVTMRQFTFILLGIAFIFASCNPSNTNETSSETRVNSFTFYEDTLNPGLTEMVYKIEHLSDTGLIYSKDSLRFGTCLDSVVPHITYKAVPGSATFYLPDDTIFSTGTDTVNLSKKPVYLHVIASDMQTYRWYRIDINVHQVNPDLYVWTQLSDNIVPHEHYDSRAFCINHQFVLFVNNGLSTQIYTSKNASDWSAAAQPIGLPTPCHVRDIVQMGQTLYYIDKQQLYTSTDLIHWSATDYSSATFAPINMLMAYNEQAWCIIQDHASQRMQLATIDGTNIIPATNIEGLDQGFLPTSFPISDFAATAFTSSSERPRAMIVGGRSTNGSPLNSRWNLEYIPSTNDHAQGIYRLKDFTISQPTFHTLTGASIVEYGGHLIMFGGIDNDLEWNSNILYSKDEGMNWYQPDTANNQLPLTYGSRQNQSVIVEQNSIYLIGGQSASQAYSDVYQGYLNSLQFK
jgi:hypothetical protein